MRVVWKVKIVSTLTRLCLLYKEARNLAAPAQGADVAKLRRGVTELKGKQEEKRFQLQT